MKIVYFLILSLLFTLGNVGGLVAEDADTAMERVASDVAALKIGFGDYILGQKLNEQQKKNARNNPIDKTIKGSYKFYDAGAYIIASIKTDTVIGLYQENPEASQEDVKSMVGNLMMKFEEPTTMAHDKLIYWAYGKDGRIAGDVFDAARQSGGSEVLATVKFSSSLPVRPSAKPKENGEEDVQKEKVAEEVSSVYVMITSNPLSTIFMAQNK